MNASPEFDRRGRIAHPFIIVLAIPIIGLLLWKYVFPSRVDPQPETEQTAVPKTIEPGLTSPDPRLTYTGPFKNIHPDVAYVSEETCAKCHPRHAKAFCQHPMALTLRPIAEVKSLPLDSQAHNPFEAFGQQFKVLVRDGHVLHSRSAYYENGKPIFQQEIEVQYAVGSGTHAHSYLTIRDSTVLQTPITWFAQEKRWDLSPRFQHHVFAGRRVALDCLFCHSNGANEDSRDELRVGQPVFPNGLGIGCQRCHGPGGEHVRNPGHWIDVETTAGMQKLDPTIVNPAHLSPQLRESVCWQCHLEGDVRVQRRGRSRYDYRPGLPLESFIAVFDDAADASYDEIVNHVEQMVQSRCYKKSSGPGQMGCVSCHDPHEKPTPDKQTAFYRTSCLKCHHDKPCSLPLPQRLAQNKEDSCIACHMAPFATSNVEHVSATDHRVPRKPMPRKPDSPEGMRKGQIKELISVFERHNVKDDPEVDRDRALASGVLARIGRPMVVPLNREFEAAIKRDPGDVAVKVQYALRLIDRKEGKSALPLFEDALARQPENEDALFGYALACWELERYKDAANSWQRLIERTPSQRGYRAGYISMLMKLGKLEDAKTIAQAWIDYDPGIPDARFMMRNILAGLDRTQDAQEQDRIGRLLMGKKK
ncbi:MAG TPA: tetratricopeptide repeat protein [Gemmata sp.]|jgi:hypothetical protein|nr:tetratricopeptide repeat protein [Gemmata sp.]